MQLNLTNWLERTELQTNSLLISANEECGSLVNSLLQICQDKLAGHTQRQSFSADRYFKLAEVAAIMRSTSLFADKNLLLLNFKSKPNLDQQQELLELLELVDSQNFLALSCDKLDAKDLAQPWFKQFSHVGDVLLLTGDFSEIKAWAKYLGKSLGVDFTSDALELLLSMNQNNLAQLYQEINKLALLFKAPHTISLADAKANLIDNAQYNIFALAAAYLSADSLTARKIFLNICQSNDESILILWNLAEDLRKLIRIKGNLKTQPNFQSAISGLRIWGDSLKAFQKANQRLSYAQILGYFDQLAQIDLQIKGVIAGEPLIALEQLIINISQGG